MIEYEEGGDAYIVADPKNPKRYGFIFRQIKGEPLMFHNRLDGYLTKSELNDLVSDGLMAPYKDLLSVNTKLYMLIHTHKYGDDTRIFESSLDSTKILKGEYNDKLVKMFGIDYEEEKLERLNIRECSEIKKLE